MFVRFSSTLLLLCTLLPGVAQANEAAIRKSLAAAFPDQKIQGVTKTAYAGLYEVVMDDQIFYTDKKTGFVLVGSLFDLKTQRNLTEARMQEITRVPFEQLPLDQAIKVVRGNGKRVLAVFSDADCPYCKRFEAELAKMTDLTVYTFLYPIDSLHPMAGQKSKAVWCAPDRVKAWDDLMMKNIEPKNAATCDTPLAKIAELGAKLKIHGTPTVIFADGRRIPGMVPAAQLEKMLNNGK